MSANTGQKNDQTAADRYFSELWLELTKAGYSVGNQEDGKLPVTWRGNEICRIDASSAVFYDSSSSPEVQEQAHKIMSKAQTIYEYMRLLETAPPIHAEGLTGDYRQFCEHDGIVLAGHSTRYGSEFVTWEWINDHRSLWQGHYFTDYPAAKEDFALRSGLIPSERLLTDEQLTEVYCAVRERLDSDQPCSDHRREILESIQERIANCVQDLEQMVQTSEEFEYSMRPGQWPELE